MLLIQSVEGFIDLLRISSCGQCHQIQPTRILLSLLAVNSHNKGIHLREGIVENIWPTVTVPD
jgi:hypothetical protein